MNESRKKHLSSIGYQFVDSKFIPEGKDEYHLRNLQNRNGIEYRMLNAYEIEVLVRNNNTSDNWNKIHVSNAFNPELVKNCKFYGLIRIGKLESFSLEYHNVCMPVGLYNSTVISCDFGDNVVVNNVNYISHYIVGNEVMLSNIHELHVTDHAKFGNGIIKDGEDESVRVWMEVCNENAGRKILPFNGMLAGDAYLWSKHREDGLLMQRFREMTEKKFDKQRGYYGKIGDCTVIKNTSIIKDVWIGTNAYIKGANKLKNLTINSSFEAQSQIGEGCEMVNGIIGFGCRAFYGVKAVRFIMASHSQLKYGARLINSYLGNNSTISCCEVLNSLIFPAHEQHHNNSFLCASTVMGQSNIAAGATIGSNHNSRAADGEIVAARGFWPGLCVSLKHNSKFASFTLVAKGDYASELNIPLPFSLVNNDVANDRLVVMPAYWFMYNMYALARNASKLVDRDKRLKKLQEYEYDFLAPDSVNEIFTALDILVHSTAVALNKAGITTIENSRLKAEEMLNDVTASLDGITILIDDFENNSRPTHIVKVKEAYTIYKKVVNYYGVTQLTDHILHNRISSIEELQKDLHSDNGRIEWQNIGGQLIPKTMLADLLADVNSYKINSWDEIHHFYQEIGTSYPRLKLEHAIASLSENAGINLNDLTPMLLHELIDQAAETKKWMTENIYHSRAKDYQNDFKKMVYENENEMTAVLGSLDDNVFIEQQNEELNRFLENTFKVKEALGLLAEA
jgi:hypothetical protein